MIPLVDTNPLRPLQEKALKSISLFMLRCGTGLLLVLWGLLKATAPSVAIQVSDKYYFGALSLHSIQVPVGIAEIFIGAAVVAGLWRTVVLPLQALLLGIGLLVTWKYILDPLGLFLVSPADREILFFPSLTVFAASLVQIAFLTSDNVALDRALPRKVMDDSR